MLCSKHAPPFFIFSIMMLARLLLSFCASKYTSFETLNGAQIQGNGQRKGDMRQRTSTSNKLRQDTDTGMHFLTTSSDKYQA